jgi:hypothetical protein
VGAPLLARAGVIILNWLFSGSRRYGFVDLAEALRLDSLDLMERSGFREYYDPRDGTGCGSPVPGRRPYDRIPGAG